MYSNLTGDAADPAHAAAELVVGVACNSAHQAARAPHENFVRTISVTDTFVAIAFPRH